MDFALHKAVITNNVDALKEIECRLTVGDQRTPTNNTVLHLACQYGSKKCVEEILSVHGSLLLEINSRGETALHGAAREGHYDVVVLLINAAMPLTEEKKQQALQSASTEQIMSDQPSSDDGGPSSTQGRLKILIRSTDSENETALHLAVRYNREDVVRLLVQQDPDHTYLQNKGHETPLYLASIRHYDSIISIILDNCASPTFEGPDGRTALHAAVLTCGGGECVKLLLSKGNTDLVEVEDDYGWTVFHFAAYKHFHRIVELLLAEDKYVGNRSVVYKLDKKGRIAFHLAAYEGAVRVMVELLKYYPDSWEIVDGSGRNVLHIAVEKKQRRVITYILSQGSATSNNLLSQRDNEGNTPLHLIAKLACYIPQLMDQGKLDWKLDWEVTDYNNLTPLEVLQCKRETDTLPHTRRVRKVRRKLMGAKVMNHPNLRDTQNMSDLEAGNKVARRHKEINKICVNGYKEVVNTHMIVAALIATVALTAGFTMPGGFDGNKEKTQGYPQLLRKAAFKAFVILDAITVLSSISSMLLYFVSTMSRQFFFVQIVVTFSGVLNVCSIITMMLTFGTGTYAVLAPSSALAISVCVLCTFLFPLGFFMAFFPFFSNMFYILTNKNHLRRLNRW
ncbi:protein ACCELERATED CELL DEATH 6-like [Apium graveolens]|uniref:PGG domain-containing protein n=1 Tax=Apium graveolens TaxID=4045 RepID=A0A6L5B944_APIGR|nr:hypothetical protein AG4045_000766 [Apium graveolens]